MRGWLGKALDRPDGVGFSWVVGGWLPFGPISIDTGTQEGQGGVEGGRGHVWPRKRGEVLHYNRSVSAWLV